MNTVELSAARAGDAQAFSNLTEPFRHELQVHCYRMLGSLHDAEDMVQETMMRAWRRLETFEERAPLRAWLYRIATNACLDTIASRKRRLLPPARHAPADPGQPFQPPTADPEWLEPLPEGMLADTSANPEARYSEQESITLAFLTALQLLPPRQRAVLLMRDVLGWRTSEVAELLDLSASSVNSALYRARRKLDKDYQIETRLNEEPDDATQHLLTRYMNAWETADIGGLMALFREEASFVMPPSPSWYQGRSAIAQLFEHELFVGEARGRWRLQSVRGNGLPGFATYRIDPDNESYVPATLQLLSIAEGAISNVTAFFDPRVFEYFDLPGTIPANGS